MKKSCLMSVEVKKKEKIIQEYTDSQVQVIEDRVSLKEKEIMTI